MSRTGPSGKEFGTALGRAGRAMFFTLRDEPPFAQVGWVVLRQLYARITSHLKVLPHRLRDAEVLGGASPFGFELEFSGPLPLARVRD